MNDNNRTYTAREQREFSQWWQLTEWMLLDREQPKPANDKRLNVWAVEIPKMGWIKGTHTVKSSHMGILL